MRLPFGQEAKLRREHKKQSDYEARVVRYGELLLKDKDGNPRVAVVDEILAPDAEPNTTTSRVRFYAKDGGYYIDEFRDNNDEDVVFHEYMEPHPEFDASDPRSPKWLVGMERRKYMRFSPEPGTDIRPFLNILENCFGPVPVE